MRDASSIKVVESLLGKGVTRINAYDPLANEVAKVQFIRLKTYCLKKFI